MIRDQSLGAMEHSIIDCLIVIVFYFFRLQFLNNFYIILIFLFLETVNQRYFSNFAALQATIYTFLDTTEVILSSSELLRYHPYTYINPRSY